MILRKSKKPIVAAICFAVTLAIGMDARASLVLDFRAGAETLGGLFDLSSPKRVFGTTCAGKNDCR